MRAIIPFIIAILGAVGGFFVGKLIMGIFKRGGATMVTISDVAACYALPIILLAIFGWILGEYLTKK